VLAQVDFGVAGSTEGVGVFRANDEHAIAFRSLDPVNAGRHCELPRNLTVVDGFTAPRWSAQNDRATRFELDPPANGTRTKAKENREKRVGVSCFNRSPLPTAPV